MEAIDIGSLSHKLANKQVFLQGWVDEFRNLNNIKFIILKDQTGKVQTIALKNKTKEEVFNKISEITLESAVEVKGTVKKNKEAKQGFEVLIEDLKVVAKALPRLPIDTSDKSQTKLDKKIDYISLSLRTQKTQAIFKIQSQIINAFREHFFNKGFIEIQPPGIIGASTEGGTNLFKMKYFEKNAYLAQSPQLYKQLAAISLKNVFSTSPVWRAEKHNTLRHLNECRQLDIEMAFADEFTVMKQQEEVVKYIVKKVIDNCQKEIEILGLKLKVPKAKYLSYKEAIGVLAKHNFKMKHGDDFEPEAEKKLSEIFPDAIIFTYEWPQELKPFYIWPKENGLSGGFDSIYGGIELTSGGKRIHIPEILIKRLKEKDLNPKDFEWYIDAFRYGAPAHAGWSIGLERLTMIICDLKNIREGCMFPRDRDRLTP